MLSPSISGIQSCRNSSYLGQIFSKNADALMANGKIKYAVSVPFFFFTAKCLTMQYNGTQEKVLTGKKSGNRYKHIINEFN